MTSTKLLFFILLMSLTSSLSSQYTSCDYVDTLSGLNSFPRSKSTEARIVSSAEYTINTGVNYSSPDVQLLSPFQIPQSGTLNITSDGCVRSCMPSEKSCKFECPSDYNTEVDERGLPFVKHEVIITFPDNIFAEMDPNDGYIIIRDPDQNQIGFDIPGILKEFRIDESNLTIGTLKRCLCDDNIFFYRDENMIFDEGGIRRVNRAAGGVKEEGGIFSLNYIVDIDEIPFDSTGIVQNVSPSDVGQFANYDYPNNHIVTAILDSGINPYRMPTGQGIPNALYFGGTLPACGLSDFSGYNFVDDNNDVIDDRGHGTLVSLAYLDALDNLAGGPGIYLSQRLLTVKVLNECGYGTLYSTLCGMKYAQAKGAKIVNCSWGLEKADRNMQRVVYELVAAGIHIVSSAGNQNIPLGLNNHFPSGYGQAHDYFIDEDKTEKREGLNNVWEVGGACAFIGKCYTIPENLPLASFSNFRESENQFVEPARGAEYLLPEEFRPQCTIDGTSYAAPILAAGLVEGLLLGDVLKPDVWGSSFPNIHPDFQRRSYYIRKCN